MKIIQVDNAYVLGFDSHEEAQAELDKLTRVAEPAPEVALPVDVSASTSHETIVPIKKSGWENHGGEPVAAPEVPVHEEAT